MKLSRYIQNVVKAEMTANGTLARIDARKAKHHEVAISLGFSDAQEAYNKLGKNFLLIANDEPTDPADKTLFICNGRRLFTKETMWQYCRDNQFRITNLETLRPNCVLVHVTEKKD